MKGLVYAAVDAATVGRGIPRHVNGERIRFPAAHARYYPRSYQPETADFIRRHARAGTTAIDIGAHIGVFTVPMARVVGQGGRVLAFEPTDSTRGVLTRTVRMNQLLERVEIRPEAVADFCGDAPYLVTGGEVGNANRLTDETDAGVDRVRTTSIDRLVAGSEPVSLLKIDAEGAELAVLRGAARTIERCRPAITLDVHAGLPGFGEPELREIWTELSSSDHFAPYRGGLPDEDQFLGATETFELALAPVS